MRKERKQKESFLTMILKTLENFPASYSPIGIGIGLDPEGDALDNSYAQSLSEAYNNQTNPSGIKGYVSALLILVGLFLLSPNITGNVIGDFSTTTSSFIGLALLFLGIFGAFLVYRLRKEEIDSE